MSERFSLPSVLKKATPGEGFFRGVAWATLFNIPLWVLIGWGLYEVFTD